MAKYSRGQAEYSRGQTDGLEAALAIHLCVYCAAAACFALGFFALLQPSRHPNSGMAAYKAPPAMVVTYLPSFRNSGDPRSINSAEAKAAKSEIAKSETSKGQTAKAEAKPQTKPETAAQEARAEAAKRQRAASARKERREPRMEYAEQPFSGGFRPSF